MRIVSKEMFVTEKQKKRIALSGIILMILLMLAIFWFVGRPLLQFVSQPERFRAWVDSHGLWGRLAFVGMMILQVFIAVIPGEPLEIGAGYAFGAVEGTLLCMLGIAIGSALVFAFVRKFGVKAVEVFFTRQKIDSIQFLQNTKKLNLLVFIIFFIPGTPKDILTYFVGLTKMRFLMWIAISSVARIPSIITSTISGNALGMGNRGFAVLVFVITLALSATGLLIYNRLSKPKEERTNL
jgi:uncharacterized membrane protein YdjX (TVP38/TMEM64 family)